MKPTPLDVLAKERPPLDRNKQRFAISQLLSDLERREAERYGGDTADFIEERLAYDVNHNLRELGETVARELLGRGPHVVDFRFTREYSSFHRGELCLIDTTAIPVQVRHSYSPIVMMDSELERWRPPIRTPRISLDERCYRDAWSQAWSKPPKTSTESIAKRFVRTLKKLSEPTVYDGPKATDKHHTI